MTMQSSLQATAHDETPGPVIARSEATRQSRRNQINQPWIASLVARNDGSSVLLKCKWGVPLLRIVILATIIGGSLAFPVGASAEPALEQLETCRRFAAISDEDPLQYRFDRNETLEDLCRRLYWRHVPVKPVEAVLDRESYARYQAALETQDCDGALTILVPEFVAAHPQLPSILKDIE